MLKINGVLKYELDRKGSLHLISKCRYLGKFEKDYVTISGQIVTHRYYNVAFLFSRITKEGKLINRYRVLGIGYNNNKKFDEFNRVFEAIAGKPLCLPENRRLVDFENLGYKIEKAITENQAQVYIQWKNAGSYSTIEYISLFTGEQIIFRNESMDFPKEFYEKYLPSKDNGFPLSVQE